MLQNPYPPPEDENDARSCRFATYIPKADRAALFAMRPERGTPQAIVNHLIQNFCNDLRDLKLDFYRADSDDILAILIERRPLTDDQVARLRLTSFGTFEEIPTGLHDSGAGTRVRQRPAGDETGAHNPPQSTARRKRPVGKGHTSSDTKSPTPPSETQSNG